MADYFEGDPRSNRERMLAGDYYIADDPDNERLRRRGVQLADAYRRADMEGDPGAREILADLLGTLGEETHVQPPLFVDYGENIHLGRDVFINYNLMALDVAEIRPQRAAPHAHPPHCPDAAPR